MGIAFFILKKQSKIAAIILLIMFILDFVIISNISTAPFLIFVIYSLFKAAEATHKLKKYRNNIE